MLLFFLFSGLRADSGTVIETLVPGGYSFNDTCNALNDAKVCENDCQFEFQECLANCVNDADPQKCRSLCNREHTTCYDRCPCHDKCSWGCPCGFYQCNPQCNYEEDIEYNKKCAEDCIYKADDFVSNCLVQGEEEHCYANATQIAIECFETTCPCYDKCPTCRDYCSDYCPSPPTDQEKCEAVWGAEEQACMEECDKPRKDCYDACQTGECKDECDAEWIQREVCCHRFCPCHTGCSTGCPCTGDWECGEPELNNNDFCQSSGIEFPEPDKSCIEEHQEIVTECITPCLENSYECAMKCEEGDSDCTDACKMDEYYCKKKCPCYEDCPAGCPCAEWCGSLPCHEIFHDERDCCEDKCYQKYMKDCRDDCDQLSPDAHPEYCYDDCVDAYAECYDSCPCHTECPNGCPCNNENTLDNMDCCGEFEVKPPNSTECTLLWEPEMLDCRNHCSAQTQVCIRECEQDDQEAEDACRQECVDSIADCIRRCPCYEECEFGCPCPYYADFPNFCPNKLPDARCLADIINNQEMNDCHDYCHQTNHECVIECPEYNLTDSYELSPFTGLSFYDDEEPQNATCLEQCRENGILCPIDCPCHENCPNGCPCGYISEDCDPDLDPKFPADPDLTWCAELEPTETPDDPYCGKLWEEEIEDCTDYCNFIKEGCNDRCGITFPDNEESQERCEELCERQSMCCLEDCPCNENCPHGCPCTAVECPGGTCVCPELESNSECMDKWGQFAKRCDFDCLDAGYNCIDRNCTEDLSEEELHECYRFCKDEEIECILDCPCYRDCPNGCDVGSCPTWDAYCPVTTPVPTTTSTTGPWTTTAEWTTGESTTTGEYKETSTTIKVTTTTAASPIGPTAPPTDDITGDTLLILSDEKAMLHNWPKDKSEYWYPLRNSANDFNAVFDNNDYWVKDACSVQFEGDSYLIGGAYNCAGGNSDNCEHINIQKSVVKLSRTKCGIEIVWDGFNQKLPFDMKGHSCAQFQKRIGNTGQDFKPHVMLCSPDNTADDPNNDKVEIERYCWSTAYMTANQMNWAREPSLKTQHLAGSMIQHKGRLIIVGGNGDWKNQDGQDSIDSVEFLNQNGILNSEGSFGEWTFGTRYPIYVQETSILSLGEYVYVIGGLVYDDNYDPAEDSAKFNTREVYKNLDPSAQNPWEQHGSLLRPRANHDTVLLGEQVYHVAGYAKDYSEEKPELNGRRVEKWESIDSDDDKKMETADKLFNYISPEVFIVDAEWYKNCGV